MLRRLPSWSLLALCVSLPAAAGDGLAARRPDFARALDLAERGPESAAVAAAKQQADHPLAAYLEYALLRRQLASAPPARVRGFLERHRGSPLADALRDAWLAHLADQGNWTGYRAFYAPQPLAGLPALQRCSVLRARLDAGVDAALLDDIEASWLAGTSLPERCDPAFAALEAAGRITPALAWKRIALAADAGEPALMRYLARRLPAAAAARAIAFADFIARPSGDAADWHPDPLARTVATLGLQRLARSDPDAAERLLAALEAPLALEPGQRGAVRNAIALWSAASYLPASKRRFAAVPADAWDERLHEWHVREALARSADRDALAALASMPETQRAQPRWRYLQARLHERQGEHAAAAALLRPLAGEPNYHGFLAADRLDAPYALCPREPELGTTVRRQVAATPALVRALELFALDRRGWATREWHAALRGFDDAQRHAAVALAVDAGWYDRAVFALDGEHETTFYTLRFPIDHGAHLRRAARKQQLDPAWVAALIRAESVWMADARSPAAARGLMQLVPATGKALARELGMRWSGAGMLYQPLANITLGTAYLRAMLDRFEGTPAVATAAYNAGPTPATRWSSERPRDDIDLWIETIPYKETREYVARVFAFSVIYDWRLNGDAAPLTARLAGTASSERRGFACPGASAPSTGLVAARP